MRDPCLIYQQLHVLFLLFYGFFFVFVECKQEGHFTKSRCRGWQKVMVGFPMSPLSLRRLGTVCIYLPGPLFSPCQPSYPMNGTLTASSSAARFWYVLQRLWQTLEMSESWELSKAVTGGPEGRRSVWVEVWGAVPRLCRHLGGKEK